MTDPNAVPASQCLCLKMVSEAPPLLGHELRDGVLDSTPKSMSK
eukprot:CAMPEP_0169108978 /NCGR_PEP_ID=MMETSP1015-20121227/25718_1 /TAXON_ID=342587 /ORGANISM="Karlodinium micrum, Strain CCMP2283" /LENGTH=43 /DNA_ID= /DNA_START= /DNA_END= /DNA_ORIENTATION=